MTICRPLVNYHLKLPQAYSEHADFGRWTRACVDGRHLWPRPIIIHEYGDIINELAVILYHHKLEPGQHPNALGLTVSII
jgi:hypothetical protein